MQSELCTPYRITDAHALIRQSAGTTPTLQLQEKLVKW